jgi:hypothetical protein
MNVEQLKTKMPSNLRSSTEDANERLEIELGALRDQLCATEQRAIAESW